MPIRFLFYIFFNFADIIFHTAFPSVIHRLLHEKIPVIYNYTNPIVVEDISTVIAAPCGDGSKGIGREIRLEHGEPSRQNHLYIITKPGWEKLVAGSY